MRKAVRVVFDITAPEGIEKEYSYYTDITNIQAGDFAVVEVKSTLKIVRVEGVFEDTLENAYIFNQAKKYVIDVIDTKRHEQRKVKSERLEYIKDRLEERKAKLEEVAIYEMLAKADPDSAKLLDEMKQLTLEV